MDVLDTELLNLENNNEKIMNDRINTPPISRTNSKNSVNESSIELNENMKNITEAMDKMSKLKIGTLLKHRLVWEKQMTDYIINTSEKLKILENDNMMFKENLKKFELHKTSCLQRYNQFLEFRCHNTDTLVDYLKQKK